MEMNETRVLHIKEVWYVFTSDVSGVGSLGSKATVVLKNGKDWARVYFTPGTANLEEETQLDGRVNSVQQKFGMVLPGEDESSTEWVDETENRPVLLKLVASSGTKLLGTLDAPCRMKIGYSMMDSGMVVRVERKGKEKARWLDE
jgi:hypothetical protein